MRSSYVLPCCALWALWLVGCGEDFPPSNQLGEELRVMGVRGEPTAPLPGQEQRLEALVYSPSGQARLRWSWCPLLVEGERGLSCAISAEALSAATGVEGLRYELGEGDAVTWRAPLPEEALRGLCEGAFDIALPGCDGGLPVHIVLEVEDGDRRELATKAVTLSWEASDAPNQNPPLPTRLEALVDGAPVTLAEGGQEAALPMGRALRLEIAISPSASQRYAAPWAPPGEDPSRQEALLLTWLVEGGQTEQARTSWIDGEGALEALGRNTWTTPARGGASALYLVLRDGRGGVSWRRFPVRLR